MLRENDLVGANIEGYCVVAELSASSYMRVFLGESLSPTIPDERVVIKLVRRTRDQTSQEQENILQAISSLQELHHPHILPILSTGTYDAPYLITKYMASGSLHDRLQSRDAQQPMPQEEALSLLAQIGQALHYAHQQHVIHGSLKPQNVLFDADDEVLLTDFYVRALLLSDQPEPKDSHASDVSVYLAPEQLSGQLSEKSDQYALGCLAYEMLTGSKAFMIPSVNTPGMYYKTKALIEPGRLNPALPSHIEKAILKAMSRDPAQRHHDIQAFLTALGIVALAEEHDRRKMAAVPTQVEMVAPVLLVTPMAVMDAMDTLEIEDVKKAGFHDEITLKKEGVAKLTWKTFSPTRQRVFVVILCLVATMIITGALFLPPRLSNSSKSSGAISDATIITRSAIQSDVPAISSTSLPSGGVVALQGTVPPQDTIPVQGVVSTQGAAPNPTSIPILTPTPASTPTSASGPISKPGSSPTSKPISVSAPTPNPVPTPTSNPAPTPTPRPLPTPTPIPASVPVQVSLFSFFNNEGVGSAPGAASFDGSGFSYPINQLPNGSSISLYGVSYRFPGTGPATNDNIIAAGQTIPLAAGHYQSASLLASASWGPVTGTVIIKYTDGSSAATSLTVADWYVGPSHGLQTSYRYSPNKIDPHPVYIYTISVPLDATRTVSALVLPSQLSGPSQKSRLHVFALTVLP